MRRHRKQNGFSLTEVLLATGILAMGFVLIALVFPVGIKLTSLATEKTLSPAIGQEAQSIVWLYGLDPANTLLVQNPLSIPSAPTYSKVFSPEYLTNQSLIYFCDKYDPTFNPATDPLPTAGTAQYQDLMDAISNQLAADSLYPSFPSGYLKQHPDQKQRYCWIALCRPNAAVPKGAEVNVFVCRKIEGARYYNFPYDPLTPPPASKIGRNPADQANPNPNNATDYTDHPVPIPVRIITTVIQDQIQIDGTASQGPVFPLQTSHRFFTEGNWVIDDRSGAQYQIVKREDRDNNGTFETLTLDRNYVVIPGGNNLLWVVPPPVGTGRTICIAVY